MFVVEILCKDKDEYLIRLDLGRKFFLEIINNIKFKFGIN